MEYLDVESTMRPVRKVRVTWPQWRAGEAMASDWLDVNHTMAVVTFPNGDTLYMNSDNFVEA